MSFCLFASRSVLIASAYAGSLSLVVGNPPQEMSASTPAAQLCKLAGDAGVVSCPLVAFYAAPLFGFSTSARLLVLCCGHKRSKWRPGISRSKSTNRMAASFDYNSSLACDCRIIICLIYYASKNICHFEIRTNSISSSTVTTSHVAELLHLRA